MARATSLRPAPVCAALLGALMACPAVAVGQGADQPSDDPGQMTRRGADHASGPRTDDTRRSAAGSARRDRAVFLYGGQWSATRFVEILQLQTDFRNTHMGAIGVSRIMRRFNRHLHLEAEVNVARHRGMQAHFEVNAAVSLRWNTFPWDRVVDTSLAYGLGPSFALDRPRIEERPDRPASRVLVFMVGELALAPPGHRNASWEGFVRIHHRSGMFDVVSESAGSNFVTAGLRHRF
ncbi:hypothetical protein [Thioalkalivibrio thiocyanodenitrificans]|uniref:hypothetical protein n=1 Tax=Thioalkalivibrio thiocyanodenitrificans TaxID=243063 RepID=UPI0018DC2DBC|nr:hypothetical protein [Thioalkalivibrio thiocyanodenitrificans]